MEMVRAPEIGRPNLTWFNCEKPLKLADLRGRFVILDFWTYCCINCIQILPTLRRIEELFPEEVVIIGVHSPKFAAERDAANVMKAVERYNIKHPIVHDPFGVLWDEYRVRAWPTLVFVSPEGYLVGQRSGEPDPDFLVQGIRDLVHHFWEKGELLKGDNLFVPSLRKETHLSFPGKIKPLEYKGEKAWAVADSGHHQIVVFNNQGQELTRFGSGEPGFGDGIEGDFNSPQGLTAGEGLLYVADTNNHALRQIDLNSGEISTLAGIGERGNPLSRSRQYQGVKTALASPWDLELSGYNVCIANAGTHQLLFYNTLTRNLELLAGNGGEDLQDGPGEAAMLAQPSGLALSKGLLYFADSETSAIRRISLKNNYVETLIGQGLFDFGHEDGDWDSALLQHPLGLCLAEDRLFVADSYNQAIRVIDLKARSIETLELSCGDDLCLPWGEPAGVTNAGDDRLLLSDTNNHRILEINIKENSYKTWVGFYRALLTTP